MSSSRIPSPARSQGSAFTPRRQKPRRTRSMGSPARTNASGRLSTLIQEYREKNMGSMGLSPLVRRSILTDDTNIEEPRRTSWWKKLDENSTDVMEVLEDNKMVEPNNIIEELDIEILSQEKKNYTLDLPESSDSESINSIVLPQRKLFTEKENHPQKKFGQLIDTRDTLGKLHKTNVTTSDNVNAAPKELFQNKPRSKPLFPAALLNISPNKTAGDKTLTAVEPKGQVRNIFGNRQATKRKNMFANFIVSESEDEIPDIQPKVFGFQRKSDAKRRGSTSSRGIRDLSPTSSVITDTEFDDWKLLPSSTMVENQLEAMMTGGHSPKRARLMKLSEEKEYEMGTNSTEMVNNTNQYNKSTSRNKSKTVTKENSTEQNTSISARSTRSKNKSREVDAQNASILNQTENVDQAPGLNNQTQVISKIISKSQSVQSQNAIDIVKSHEQNVEPIEDNDDEEFNFTLEYDNADEVDIAQEANQQNKSATTTSKNENQKNISKKEISPEDSSTRNARNIEEKLHKSKINKIVEESVESMTQDNDKLNKSTKEMSINKSQIGSVEKSAKKRHDEEIVDQKDLGVLENINVQNKSHTGLIEEKNTSVNDSQKSKSKEQEENESKIHENEMQNRSRESLNKNKECQDQSQFKSMEHECEPLNNDNENKKQNKSKENEESHITDPGTDFNKSEEEENKSQDVHSKSKTIQEKVHEERNESQEENDKNGETEGENQKGESQEEQNEIQGIQEESQEEQSVSQEIQDESQREQSESQEIQDESQKEQSKSQEIQDESEEEQNESQEVEDESQEKYNETNDENEDEKENRISHDEVEENDSDSTDVGEMECEDKIEALNDEAVESDEDDNQENEIDSEDEIEAIEEGAIESDEDENQDNEIECEDEVQAMDEEVGESDDDENQENEIECEDEVQALDEEVGESDDDENQENEIECEDEVEAMDAEVSESDENDNQIDSNEEEDICQDDDRDTETPNVSHDTTGRNRNKDESPQESHHDSDTPNVSHDTMGRNRKKDESPEVILHDKTNQVDSFTVHGRNTSVRKTKSMIKDLNIRPSLAPVRDSISLSDGTKNSIGEGSWDSHRVTRKTLRKTFGKDFTPRKSLRALVMEKSAQRQTIGNITSMTAKFPQANSTEFPEESAYQDNVDHEPQESDHEVSRRTRQTTLEMYLQKIMEQNMEKKAKMEEAVRNSLKAPKDSNLFKVPGKPMFPRRPAIKTTKPKSKPTKSFIPLEDLPEEVIQDMKYKPPKRFQPSNAPWITKRLYKYLETKLEPKYDYKARVRSEKLVETIYHFAKDLRRHNTASASAVEVLKHEMARLDIVKTHFEFYEFFHQFMPREVRVKVVPDVVNKIPLPRHGVFADILKGNTVQG